VRANFLALLTALLTKCLLQFTQMVTEFDQRVIPKRHISLVEIRILRLDPAPSATASATASPTQNNSHAIRKLKVVSGTGLAY